MNPKKFTILIDTPDEPGLIFKITRIIYEHKLNIIHNGEFVEDYNKHFFMRTEVEGDVELTSIRDNLTATLPSKANIQIFEPVKKKLVVLVSKEHHCLADLLVRNTFGELNMDILAVAGNHNILRELTERFNIPFHHVPLESLSREEHEGKLLEIITNYNPDYLVLAKYMRILSPNFITNFPNRIINIHHSFLPAFIGANPYRQAYERGVKIIGATSHFVNNQLDEGPIIFQEVIPTDHTYSVESMRQAGCDVEKLALAKALRLVCENRLFIRDNKTIIFN